MTGKPKASPAARKAASRAAARAAGKRSIELTLDDATIARLDALAAQAGLGRAEMVARLLDER